MKKKPGGSRHEPAPHFLSCALRSVRIEILLRSFVFCSSGFFLHVCSRFFVQHLLPPAPPAPANVITKTLLRSPKPSASSSSGLAPHALPFPPHDVIHASHSFIRVDFVKQYWNSVFATFIHQYAAGLTPNPDVLCNRHVKFGHLLEHARSLGASRLATGHYARVAAHGASTAGNVSLLRPSDKFKDQTYFLCQVQV
jgi:hypothetical protein